MNESILKSIFNACKQLCDWLVSITWADLFESGKTAGFAFVSISAVVVVIAVAIVLFSEILEWVREIIEKKGNSRTREGGPSND